MRKERGGSGSGRAGRSPVRTLDKFVLQNMEELMNVLESTLNIDFIRGTISGPRNDKRTAEQGRYYKSKDTSAGEKGRTVFSAGIIYKDTGIPRKCRMRRGKRDNCRIYENFPPDAD